MADAQRREDEDNHAAEDEDTGAQIAPIVRLEEVVVTTGEEDEDVVLDLKAKLYRFDKEGNQWKERGAGTVKLLRHKQTAKVRLVMRQSKTLKICANHIVLPTTKIQDHVGNDKSCVWHANDFSDGELKEEMFCIRFQSVENCRKFRETVMDVAESQVPVEESTNEDASAVSNLVENLSFDESKSEQETPVTLNEEKEKKETEETKTE